MEWATTATLVRDNEPVLTVVHQPLESATYTAVRGRGAHLDGRQCLATQDPTTDTDCSERQVRDIEIYGYREGSAQRGSDHV